MVLFPARERLYSKTILIYPKGGIIMKKLIILLSIFLFLFVAGVGHAGDTNKPKAVGDITVNYNTNGEIVSIKSPGKKCPIEAEGRDAVKKKMAEKLMEGYDIKAIGEDLFRLHKNPTCIIYLGNIPICICCY